MPSANAPSSSAGAMATDFSEPSTSVNHRRTNRTSRSSSARSTKSSCLPIRPCLPRASVPTGYGRAAGRARETASAKPRVPDRLKPCLSCVSRSPRSTPPSATSPATPSSSWTTARQAADTGAHLVVFPEMVLTGYPIEDLALRASFVEASRAAGRALAAASTPRACGDLVRRASASSTRRERRRPTTLGHAQERHRRTPSPCCTAARSSPARPSTTCGTTASATRSATSCPATRSTSCRSAASTSRSRSARTSGATGPSAAAEAAEAGLLVVPNGSPYERDKDDARLELCARRAREAGCALAYVNLVGGQDELVFDGDSLVVDAAGTVLGRRAQFEPRAAGRRPRPARGDRRRCRTPTSGSAASARAHDHRRRAGRPRTSRCRPRIAERIDDLGEICDRARARAARLRAQERLPLGAAGHVRRHRLDAGRAIAVRRARRRERVRRLQPERLVDASTRSPTPPSMARRTGLHLDTVPIAPMVDAFEQALRPRRACRGEPPGPDPRRGLDGAVQPAGPPGARVRQQVRAGHRLLHDLRRRGRRLRADQGRAQDAGVGAGPVAQRRSPPSAGETPPIPENTITKPPSAELRPGQLDTDSLPRTTCSTTSSTTTSSATSARPTWSREGFDPELVEHVIPLVDRAE